MSSKKVLLIFPKKEAIRNTGEELKKMFLKLQKEKVAQVDMTSMDELDIYLSRQEAKAVFENRLDLASYDLVHFKTLIGMEWLYRVLKKIFPQLNTFQTLAPGAIKNKLFQYSCFYRAKLPFPRTFYTYHPDPLNRWSAIEKFCGLPVVIKSSIRAKGENVFLATNKKEARKILSSIPHEEAKFLFQEFIPNEWDARLLVTGEKVRYALKRIRQRDEWRNNTSLGAKRISWPLSEVPNNWQKLALKALQSTSYSFAGVDMVEHEYDKKVYLFEINFTPLLSPGVDRALYQYLKERIQEKSAEWE